MTEVNWELIWCCEQAFEARHTAQCKSLCCILRAYAGRLKGMQKAFDLPRPQLKPELPRWAIITDWPEAEALVEILWNGNEGSTCSFGPPMFVVIECNNSVQLSQASVLAEKVKDYVDVIIMPVCHEHILGTCLNNIIKKYVSKFQGKVANVKMKHQKHNLEQMEVVKIREPINTKEGVREYQEEASSACRRTASDFVAIEQPLKMNLWRVDKPSVSELGNHCLSISEQQMKSQLKDIILKFGMPLQTLGEPSASQLNVNDVAENA